MNMGKKVHRMSTRDIAKNLIDQIPDSKMFYVIAYLQGAAIPDESEEKADDAYCERLLKEYQDDPDPHKTDAIPLEQLAQELGIAL